jgi:light-regulated signal transduction histidine kinase (bacteriophytochrome)
MSDSFCVDSSDGTGNDLENHEQNIIELQAVKFAREFSVLYKSEKKKRRELEGLSQELRERNEELMDIIFLTSSQFLENIQKVESNFVCIKEHVDAPQAGLMTNFDTVEHSLERLQQLVGEMSKLYRVDSMRSMFRPVALDEVLAEVLLELGISLESRSGRVPVESLPVLETDRVQLRILFHQLIVLGMGSQNHNESSFLSVKAEKNVGGLWRVTFHFKGTNFLQKNYCFKKGDASEIKNRSLELCRRISQRLGGFLCGEINSEVSFSCHVFLPEKNIPFVSHSNTHIGNF